MLVIVPWSPQNPTRGTVGRGLAPAVQTSSFFQSPAFKFAASTGNPRRGFPNRTITNFLRLLPFLRYRTQRSFALCGGRSKALPLESASLCKGLTETFTLPSFLRTYCAGSCLKLHPIFPATWDRALPGETFTLQSLLRTYCAGSYLKFYPSPPATVHCQLSTFN